MPLSRALSIISPMMARERYTALLVRLAEKLQTCLQLVQRSNAELEMSIRMLVGASEKVRIRVQTEEELSYLIGLEFLEATFNHCDRVVDANTTERNQMQLETLSCELSFLSKALEFSLNHPQSDLFNEEKGSERWKSLWSAVDYIQATDLGKLNKDLAGVQQQFITVSAALSLGLEGKSTIMKRLLVGSGLFYYKMRSEEARIRANWMTYRSSVEFFRLLLSACESKLGSRLYSALLPPITLSRVIHVPKVSHLLADSGPEDINIVRHRKKSSFTLTPSISRATVPVRIVSPFPISGLDGVEGAERAWCCSEAGPEPTKTPDRLIFHIHGGGWICLSSATHENHTRQWATNTKTPVLSVDYRLAPESPYPAALEDVWEAYIWTLRYAKVWLGVDPRKIVVAGDSAGGGLALSLTYRALARRVRPPDGLLLVYPALSADPHRPTPSYLSGLKDPMLSAGLMELCVLSYLSEDSNPSVDPYLSPIQAPDQLLQQLPPVRLISGSKDPLLDDSWRLFDRLKRLSTDVKMSLFEGMPHGTLNMDLPMGLEQAHDVVTTASDYLKELLYLATKR